MSGMAIAASTTPGSVATFWSCSSDRSVEIASSSSSLANTRAGTSMSSRDSAGISQSVSPTRRSSDIEPQPGTPPVALALEREPVVGHRLHQMRRLAPPSLDDRLHAPFLERDVTRPFRDQPVPLGKEDELVQPGGEETGTVAGLGRHLAAKWLPVAGTILGDELPQRCERLLEDSLLASGLDPHLQLAGVLHPLVHGPCAIPVLRARDRVVAEHARAPGRGGVPPLPEPLRNGPADPLRGRPRPRPAAQ